MNSQNKFTALITRHAGIIHKIARMYCPRELDREDLIQDIYHQLWKAYPSYDTTYRFSTWMYRVALNTAISAYRKRSRVQFREFDEHDVIVEQSDGGAKDVLLAAVSSLRPLDKALVLLHLDGLSYSEISDILGITETNTATKLSRIKKELKTKIETLNRSNHDRS